jgi:hypothetical protein
MSETSHPIEGQVVLLAGAQASVTLSELSELLEAVQRHLVDERDGYDRRFESIEGADATTYYLAEAGHWETVCDALGLDDRETDAVARTHEQQFRRDGRRLDREDEFDSTLEIRDVVAIAPPTGSCR